MNKKENGLLKKLEEYGKSEFYPFHMPGHKRRDFMEETGDAFPDPYRIDITEINGFDNLHHAEGILKDAMDGAAKIYGADHTYFLVNGSTCGVLSAVCGQTNCGGKILMARNCHLSAYHGVLLNRLRPEYLYPEYVDGLGINGGILASDVEKALEKDKEGEDKIQAVLVVSPTYEGVVSDIPAIAAAAHRYEVPLIVDEAHGAHLPFVTAGDFFPKSALAGGADVVIQSLHKTLPSFTQTALLHIRGTLAKRERIEQYLRIFQSSSPSYVLMAGIDSCIRYMAGDGRNRMRQYQRRLKDFYRGIDGLRTLHVIRPDGKEFLQYSSVAGWDPSKIVIAVRQDAGVSGEALGELLRQRYHLEPEMCAPGYVIAMTSLMDTEEGFKRLSTAILETDEFLSAGKEKRAADETGKAKKEKVFGMMGENRQILTPALALERPGRAVRLEDSAGEISEEFVFLYPPGIPVVVPGERITEAARDRILLYRRNDSNVQGLADRSLSTILTVAPEGLSVLR